MNIFNISEVCNDRSFAMQAVNCPPRSILFEEKRPPTKLLLKVFFVFPCYLSSNYEHLWISESQINTMCSLKSKNKFFWREDLITATTLRSRRTLQQGPGRIMFYYP